MTISLLVDTDTAFDDWLALAYLVQCPLVELKAITIAATGESHATPGIDTALRILQLKDLDVPVTSGRTTPLKGSHSFPLFVRLVMDLRLGLSLPRSKRTRWKQACKELLVDQINSAADKVTLLTLGPLTNIAEVLAENPKLVDKIGMIYVMGGALNAPGNLAEILPNTKNVYAEWNIYVDYYAANIVLRSGAPITLIPLDVTNQIALTDDFYAQLLKRQKTAAADFVVRVIKRIKTLAGKNPVYFWDLVAAVITTRPDLGSYEMHRLGVVQDEGSTIGRVVEDESGGLVRVCIALDQTAFEEIVLTTLNA